VSLFNELDGAELIVADEDLALLFVWYGDAGVQILNEQGEVVDRFAIDAALGRKLSVPEVRRIIAAYRNEMMTNDE
jgi:hypothetical protein